MSDVAPLASALARGIWRFRPCVRALERPPVLDALLVALRDRPGLCALDSAKGEPRRFSLVACDPLRGDDGAPLAPPQQLAALGAFVARLEPHGGDAPPAPFAGGFLGALSYDLGVSGERQRLPRDPWGWPLVMGGLYTDYVVTDHLADRAWLVLGDEPGDGRAPMAEREALWMHALERALDDSRPLHFDARTDLRRLVPPAEHRARVQRARAAIAQGDYYQVNLAHPFEVESEGEPTALYARLRAANPAPYMGYLGFEHDGGAAAILSASPELLLECDGRSARTRPIKGTIARGADPDEDGARAAELLASEKDRAELAMIVDLERNDLGRVARVGSVRVEGLPTLRSYEAVHHLTADVTAELRAELSALDALVSLFPGGSITGAPKLASMAAIAALEREGRGPFTGSLGAYDLRGIAHFNILIRTLLWRARPGGPASAGEVRYHVGGGITWSSDPAAEDEETLAKGARLAAALARDRDSR